MAKSRSVNYQQQQTDICDPRGSFNGWREEGCVVQVSAAWTRGAVHYGRQDALHAQCFAGIHYRGQRRSRRGQEPHLWRRCVLEGGWTSFIADGVWQCRFVFIPWRSRVLLQRCLWRQRPSLCRGRSRFFVCFTGQFSLYQWEAHRWHSTAGMQWRYDNVDQGVRRTV